MKNSFAVRLVKKLSRALLLAFALTQFSNTASAALYAPGDIVTNLTFYARRSFTRPDGTFVPAGSQVKVKDFAGRVVFLDWFAVWCPYCTAAVPQIETGIVDWYAARGGNPYGVPVLYVFVNQESSASYQTATTNYINANLSATNITLNDYSVIGGANLVRPGFQTSGQPIFAIINGVTNSPSHQPWQVLVNYLGFGQTDFNATLASFRAIIDTVQPAIIPPLMTNAHRVNADFEFNFQSQIGRSYRVQGSTNLTSWTTLKTISGTNIPTVFRHTNAPPSRQFYRVVTP